MQPKNKKKRREAVSKMMRRCSCGCRSWCCSWNRS